MPNDKLKILYYGSSLSIQKGANQSMYRLAKSFNNEATEAYAVLPGREGIAEKYEQAGLKYFVIPALPLKSKRSLSYQWAYIQSLVSNIQKLRRIIRSEKIDILHVNDITFFPALFAAKAEGIKTVCHVRFISIRNRLVKWVLLFLITTFSDAIICVSRAVHRQLFRSRTRWRNASIHVVYNPSPDSVDFTVCRNGGDIRKELNIPSTAFVVCHVSKFTRNKGQHVVVRAAARFKRAGYTANDFVFLLVGGPLENHIKYYQEIKDFVSEHQLEEMVRLLGIRQDVAGLYAGSDVAIHVPVHEDPFPGVVLEAMLCGKAVVGSKSGGIPEIIDDGVNGILIPKEDADALAQTLVKLKENPQWLDRLSSQASDAVRNKFSFEVFQQKIMEIYSLLKPEKKHYEKQYETA